MISELTLSAGALAYSTGEGKITIEYFRGRGVKVEVPAQINDLPVTEIKKKAFFGAKSLRRIELPASVEKIGEWAFASCNGLEEIVIPNAHVEIGAGIFKGCDRLNKVFTDFITDEIDTKGSEISTADSIENITKSSSESNSENNFESIPGRALDSSNENMLIKGQKATLLALAALLGGTGHLIDFERAGSAAWIEELDAQLVLMLAKDDSEGFSKMLLCGEEDYVGDDSNMEVYCSLRRKEKLRLVFVRLMNPLGIGSMAEEGLSHYLNMCMPADTWELVMEEHGEEQEYYDILIKYGCINSDNIAELIESMGDKHSGMKAYLLRKKSEMNGSDSIFDDWDI